ncbi:MAG: methyltransferase cognate corrinoid protein, partial [Methanosarcinaceae archaeon]|nr:methyltransferase cognate corrinoid protein [Methanosarcinaceae archaeon]
MLTQDEINEKGSAAVQEFDNDAVVAAAQEAIDTGVDLVSFIENGLTAGMNIIGDQFDQGTLFLPHVIAASEAMSAGVDILTPELEKAHAEVASKGTIAIGTIEGDIHTIGKDILATMLKIAGFKVIDLGRDVPIADYVEAAKTADIVASSALMTTTMVLQTHVEEQLKEAGLRDKVKTMVGGAPTTQDWADKIGADLYGENAADAIVKCT